MQLTRCVATKADSTALISSDTKTGQGISEPGNRKKYEQPAPSQGGKPEKYQVYDSNEVEPCPAYSIVSNVLKKRTEVQVRTGRFLSDRLKVSVEYSDLEKGYTHKHFIGSSCECIYIAVTK